MIDEEFNLNIEGHLLRNPFWRELDEGLITFRDNLQFELKSDFFINPQLKQNTFTQEFYIFIPETLQITPQTYSMKQFYLDQTNLIRYKTPFMTLVEITDPNNNDSPLVRIQMLEDKDQILRELMLLGNIFRSTLRVRVRRLFREIEKIKGEPLPKSLEKKIIEFCEEIQYVRVKFKDVRNFLMDRFEPNHFDKQVNYVDEFMSDVIEEFLTLFLDKLRHCCQKGAAKADGSICDLLADEMRYRSENNYIPREDPTNESILYRQGLLEKFMLRVLKLQNTRVRTREKHAQYIGVMAAGVAMFVYMVLFLWGATNFVTNSAPFVMLAVVFYILKDRIKEGLKTYYHRKASVWFPDFSTEIQSPNDGEAIGSLSESFYFLSPSKIPKNFRELRYKDDIDELPAYQPSETVMLYKREVSLFQQKSRLSELNTIFRYNIHRFLEKANDPIQPTFALDGESHELKERMLPKVYHINIIIKNTFKDLKMRTCTETKKFRVILDKQGIRRVEHVNSQFEREEKN